MDFVLYGTQPCYGLLLLFVDRDIDESCRLKTADGNLAMDAKDCTIGLLDLVDGGRCGCRLEELFGACQLELTFN